MATEQELFKQYNELRERLERFVPHLVNLLKQIRLVRQSLISDEEKETKAHEAFLFFRTKTKLPSSVSQRNLLDLQTLISDIHEKNGDLESRYVRPELWARFIDQNKNLTTFFQEDNLIQIQPLVFLLTYLNGIEKGIYEQLAQVNEHIVKEAQAQRLGIAQAAATISTTQQPPPSTTEEKGISETQRREQELTKSQEQRQETLKKAKELYFNHQLEFINSLLPEGRQLPQIDLVNLAKIAADSSFSQLELDALLVRYGVVESLGLTDSPDAMAALHEILTNERHSILAQRKLEGLSTNVFPKEAAQMQEGVATVSRQLGDRVATHAYSASGRKLKELEKDADGRVDSDIATARRLREESLRSLWEKDHGIKRLMGRITGQTKANQYQLLLDLGIITPETEPIKRPRLFEEFLGAVDDQSLTDMFGVPEEISIVAPPGEELPAQPAPSRGQPTDPLATKRNLERLKVMGGVSKAALANPFIMGGAAVAGVGVYGLVTQGVAGGLGAATSALGGAIAGGLIGSAVGPIGTVVGAVVGALGVGGASLAWQPYGTASAAQMIGQFEGGLVGVKLPISGITAAAGQGVTGAAAAVSPVAAQGAAQAGATISNALSGTTSFLQNLSSIPLTSATYAGVAVVGPLIAVGVVTTLVITPSLLSVFLVPVPQHVTGDFQGKACWPTDGVISTLERYPDSPQGPGGPHMTSEGGSAIDIANSIGTIVRTPYAGTATTHIRYEGGKYLGYGVYVTVETPSFRLIFAHLDSFWDGTLTPGTTKELMAGDLIGRMDNHGNSSGSHLHYEVIGKDATGGTLSIRSIIPTVPKAEIGVRVSSLQCDNPSNMDDATNRGECPTPTTSFGKTKPPLSGPQQYCFEGKGRLGKAALAYLSQIDQGFCDFYNQPLDPQFRLSGANQLWNETKYQSSQGYYDFSRTSKTISYYDLAWCTSLVNTVYMANYRGPGSSMFNVGSGSGFAGVFMMLSGWEKATGQKPVATSAVTSLSNIPIGTAVFYGYDHVGMVCENDGTTLTSCETNTSSTQKTYTLDELKAKVTNLGFPPEGIDDQGCYTAPTVDK